MRLVLCATLLLVACTFGQTANVVDSVPVKTCSVTGFTCQVLQESMNDVGLSLQNNVGTDLSSAIVALQTTDCYLQLPVIAVGSIPADAITPVHFYCAGSVPDVFAGKLTVTYSSNGGAVSHTAEGSITIRG